MQNIAVIGDRQSVQSFRCVGFDTFEAEDNAQAFDMLRKAIKDEYPIIFITEDYAQELSANNLLSTPVFAVCIHTLQTAKPAEASADAAYPLGEPTILCSRRMKVS